VVWRDGFFVDAPRWEIQQPYFVHKAHYQFTPDSDILWSGRLPAGADVKKSASGAYSVDLTDVPPIPKEDWMPPIRSFFYEISFHYHGEFDSTDFWKSETEDWSEGINRFAQPSKAVKAAVNGQIAPGDSDLDKAKKLYAAVQALDNTDYSREKTETEMKQLNLKAAKHAEDTWTQKSGSSEDIAMLYLAMLRAAGLSAYAVKVVDRDKAVFDPSYLDTD
jgi:transglutaminase-like putative cysteine protease